MFHVLSISLQLHFQLFNQHSFISDENIFGLEHHITLVFNHVCYHSFASFNNTSAVSSHHNDWSSKSRRHLFCSWGRRKRTAASPASEEWTDSAARVASVTSSRPEKWRHSPAAPANGDRWSPRTADFRIGKLWKAQMRDELLLSNHYSIGCMSTRPGAPT